MATKKTAAKKIIEPAKSAVAKKKKVVQKKAAVKEKTVLTSKSLSRELIDRSAGIPCICIKKRNRWYCMKTDTSDGSLVRCDGPFATQEECEEHVCLD